jgi:RNA polymerase sigma-70 factor (ECF subfamily)
MDRPAQCTLGTLRSRTRAFREMFVDACYADAFRWFHWLTRDDDRSADLTQETFRAFWESLGSGDCDTLARVWLFSIGRNVWRNACRRQSRNLAFSERAGELERLRVSSKDLPAADRIFADERARAIRVAVADLPTDLREAATLRYWEDYSYNEIAAVLDITPELARQRVFQARKLLRDWLSSWAPGASYTLDDPYKRKETKA